MRPHSTSFFLNHKYKKFRCFFLLPSSFHIVIWILTPFSTRALLPEFSLWSTLLSHFSYFVLPAGLHLWILFLNIKTRKKRRGKFNFLMCNESASNEQRTEVLMTFQSCFEKSQFTWRIRSHRDSPLLLRLKTCKPGSLKAGNRLWYIEGRFIYELSLPPPLPTLLCPSVGYQKEHWFSCPSSFPVQYLAGFVRCQLLLISGSGL